MFKVEITEEQGIILKDLQYADELMYGYFR